MRVLKSITSDFKALFFSKVLIISNKKKFYRLYEMLNVNIVYNNEFDNKMEIKFRNLIHRVRDFILKSKIFLNIKVFINIV